MNDSINEKLKMNNEKFPPSDWVETTLGEVCIFNYGKGLKTETRISGNIPVYGSSGITGWHNESLIKEKGLIIGRKGSVGTIYKSEVPFYPIDTVFYITQKDTKCDLEYLYRLLQSLGLDKKNSDSAVPGLNRENAYSTSVLLPPLPEQQAIASVLSAFDDKIELLREQNKTLEEMGQTIFQEWFGKYGVDDELPEGWRVGKIKDIVDIFDSQRIPLSSNQRQEKQGKYPYHGATSIMDYVDEYLFDGIYLLLAEDGSVMDQNGYPVLQYVWDKFWVNNHAHVLQGANDFSTEMLYLLFKNTKIAGIVNGAVQLKINQTNLMNLEVIIPDQETLKQFDEAIQPIFGKIRDNSEQIQSLARSRDELLARLMRGEVRVSF